MTQQVNELKDMMRIGIITHQDYLKALKLLEKIVEQAHQTGRTSLLEELNAKTTNSIFNIETRSV